jgi:hypothetical protein
MMMTSGELFLNSGFNKDWGFLDQLNDIFSPWLHGPFSLALASLLRFLNHTIRHMVGLLWMTDQPVAEASTYTGQHKRQTSMPRAGFELAIPETKRPQTYALDRAAPGIG